MDEMEEKKRIAEEEQKEKEPETTQITIKTIWNFFLLDIFGIFKTLTDC